MQNSKGKLVQWTTENGTVLRTLDALLDYMPETATERAVLGDVANYFGQECTLVQVYREDHPASYEVQFADGFILFAFLGDVVFD